MQRDKSPYSLATVEKALEILDILTQDLPAPTLTFLSERLGLSRNKTFRLLATLETKGLITKEDQTGYYRLDLPAAELAQKVLRNVNLIRLAHPIMETLARKHDEAIYLTVLAGDEVLFLDMVDTVQQVKAAPLVGNRFPFFTNAAGKAIRALESREFLEKFRRRRSKVVLPDIEKLEHELNLIREKGVAVDHGGLGEGIITVAVAIKDYAGKVVGALTVLGPSFRLITERVEQEIIPSLLEGAEILSFKFGYARM